MKCHKNNSVNIYNSEVTGKSQPWSRLSRLLRFSRLSRVSRLSKHYVISILSRIFINFHLSVTKIKVRQSKSFFFNIFNTFLRVSRLLKNILNLFITSFLTFSCKPKQVKTCYFLPTKHATTSQIILSKLCQNTSSFSRQNTLHVFFRQNVSKRDNIFSHQNVSKHDVF